MEVVIETGNMVTGKGSDLHIDVSLEYFGEFKKRTGKSSERYSVNGTLEQVTHQITWYLKEEYGIETPYTMMIGDSHIVKAKKENNPVKIGDLFRIIPFFSGG